MTQLKDNDTFTIQANEFELDDNQGNITINLNDTYGTTTSYWGGNNITDINVSSDYDGTFTITDDTINIGDWAYCDNKIDPDKVKRMCKQYPALKKVWENFNSMYEMCKQDYEGKVKAGEIDEFDDDIPF